MKADKYIHSIYAVLSVGADGSGCLQTKDRNGELKKVKQDIIRMHTQSVGETQA